MRCRQSVAEPATRHVLHRNLITQWRRQAIEKFAKVFDDKGLVGGQNAMPT